MTLSSLNITDTFTGTGANTVLPTTFTFYTSEQIQVTKRELGTNEETVLVEDTHYTVVDGAGGVGSVTPVDGATDFPTTVEWEVKRATPLTQLVDLVPNVALPSQSIEEAHDRSRMIQQEQDAQRTLDLGEMRPRNYLYNGEFRANQRLGSPYTVDNAYAMDRWRLLHNGISTTLARDTTVVPTGTVAAAKMTMVTGVSSKMGMFQVAQSFDSVALAGSNVSLSFDARLLDASDVVALKAMVLYFTGTPNAVSADPIITWGSAGALNFPTLAAGWSYALSPNANLAPLTDSYQRYELTGIPIPASAVNVAVFIWANDFTPNGDGFYLANVQLEKGDVAHTFERVAVEAELQRCRSFFEHLPMNNFCTYGNANRTDQMSGMIRWRRKRVDNPFVFDLTPGGGTNWLTIDSIGGFAFPATVVMTTLNNHGGGIIQATMSSPLWTIGDPITLAGNIATAFVSVDAEL
jgi:hypothetical protein